MVMFKGDSFLQGVFRVCVRSTDAVVYLLNSV